MAHVQLFISAVSKEFAGYREALRKALKRRDVDIHIQEDFGAAGVPTLEKLDAYIADCDAVIHLAGHMTGAMTNPHSLDALKRLHGDLAGRLPPLKSAVETGLPELSYTQWEAYLAIYYRKRLLIAEPFDTAPREKSYVNEPKQVEAQRVHLASLAALNCHPEINFATADKLIIGVLNALVDILEPEPKSKPINLPYPSVGPLFKGRDDVMAELRASLGKADGGRAAIVGKAVHGLGGVGKTRLAIEYAWRYEAEYTALLFVVAEARSVETALAADVASPSARSELRRSLAALSGPFVLGLHEHEQPDEERRVLAVIQWLQANEGWLLIIDNADSEDSAREVENLLPHLRGGHVLITSRRSVWSKAIARKELGLLSPDAAKEFLLSATADGRQSARDDILHAGELSRELGYLALALEQAAAYIERHHLSFVHYLKAWRENHDAVTAWFDASMNYPMSFAVTWRTSVARLKPDSRDLLKELSFFSPDPIPASLLDSADPLIATENPRAALAELNSYSLISWAKGASTFSVHRLVQDVTRRSLAEDERTRVLRRALAWIARAFDLDPFDSDNWLYLESLIPHARALAEYGDSAEIADPTGGLLSRIGDLLRPRVPLGDVVPLFLRSLALIRQQAKVHPNNALVQRRLFISSIKVGDVLVAQGNLDEALALYRDSHAILDRYTGADPDDGSWQRNLSVSFERIGDVLVAQRKLSEALNSYRNSLVIAERLAQADPANIEGQRDLSVSHNKLGRVLLQQEKLEEALKSFRDSLAVSERLSDANPENMGAQRDRAIAHNFVGNVLLAKGSLDAALVSYRAYQSSAERLTRDDPGNTEWQRDLSISYNKVGDVLAAQHNLSHALKSYRNALAIADRLARADPGNAGLQRDLSVSHTRVGDLLLKQNKPVKALEHYRADLKIAEKLSALDPSNAVWHQDAIISHQQIITALLKIGANKLSAEQKVWLKESETQLALRQSGSPP